MLTPTLPQSIYFAIVGDTLITEGFFAGDYETDVEHAIDSALQSCSDGCGFRIFRLEFDPDTNLPERTTDVTEDVVRARNKWLISQGRDPITKDQCPVSDYALEAAE